MPKATQRSTLLNWLAGTAAVVFYVAISLVSGVGVLGADPYWYAGDLSMLKATGEATTNAILPSTFLDSSVSPGHLPHWVHNVPFTHAVSWFRMGFGSSYSALLISNIVLALATAFLILLISRKAGLRSPVASAVLFLTFPLTMLLTLNAYSEMLLAFAAAMTVYGGQLVESKARGSLGLGIAGGGVALLYFSRENFILALPAFVLFCLWAARDADGRFHPLRAIPFPLLILTAAATKGWLLPTYPNAGLNSLLMSSTSQNPSNMTAYHSTHTVSFSLTPFLSKIGTGLYEGVVPASIIELIVETAVVVVVVLGVLVLRRTPGMWSLTYWSVTFLGIYIATEAAFTTQNRYIYSVVPLASVLATGLWEQSIADSNREHSRQQRLVRMLSVGTLTLMLTFSSLIALNYRLIGLKTNEQIRVMVSEVSQTGTSPIMVVADNERKMPITYAALPRPVISIDRTVNSFRDATNLIERWKPEVFVSGSEKDRDFLANVATRAYGPTARLRRVDVLDTPGGDAEMFTIDTSRGTNPVGRRGRA